MKHVGRYFAAVAATFALALTTSADDKSSTDSRTFELRYAAKIEGITAGMEYRLWAPIAPSNDDQTVTIISRDLPPGWRTTHEAKYGNELLYLAGKTPDDKPLEFAVTYKVRRKELRGEQPSSDDAAKFLKPDARVPVGGKSLTLLRDKDLPADRMRLARFLYDTVFDHMRYSKEGTGWGLGDSDWACDSRYGNCSDFHSLFISLARAKGIPAKFEIGYGLPAKRGEGDIAGYHCWAKFKSESSCWVGVDISEARKNPTLRDYYFGNLTADRVAFTTGRDLVLEPTQDGPPINFLIAPYVEVTGKPLPADKIKMKVSFRDVN
jgi:transglutaminase-like putative cysteine protease